jgi:hypothetical protein
LAMPIDPNVTWGFDARNHPSRIERFSDSRGHGFPRAVRAWAGHRETTDPAQCHPRRIVGA